MREPFFFGYGSLVNRATHDYADHTPATLSGWRRRWRHTRMRDVAFLTAYPVESAEIDGLIAHVPGDDWAALDIREGGYTRRRLMPEDLRHGIERPLDVQIYEVRQDEDAPPSTRHPVLLSYLDCVVQGFLEVFGEAGVERFFDSTDGWDAPILNDRAAPIYPRAQVLSKHEAGMVDAHLDALSAHVQELHETRLP